jgi:hypothetical protein
MFAFVFNAEVRGETTGRMLCKKYTNVRGTTQTYAILWYTLWLIPEHTRQPLDSYVYNIECTLGLVDVCYFSGELVAPFPSSQFTLSQAPRLQKFIL